MYLLLTTLVVTLVLIGGTADGATTSISTSLFDGYALIGANANSKMPFVTLLSKQNKSLPYAYNNKYQISQIFNDPAKLYGSSVSLGPATLAQQEIVIGAIGSPNEAEIYVYNIEECIKSNSSKCDPLITFNAQKASNHVSGNVKHLYADGGIGPHRPHAKPFECNVGSIMSVGPNFIVSSCQNDLLDIKKDSSPITICFLDLDTTPGNCSEIDLWDDQFRPCPHERGQLYVTAIDTEDTIVTFSYCAVCMVPSYSQIQVQYVSSFVILNVTGPGAILPINTVLSNRTNSCPTSISINNEWVTMGYTEESAVDLFQWTSGTNFTFFETITEDVPGFGSSVVMDNNLLVISTPGNPTQQIGASVYFYELFTADDGTPIRASIEATVPNLNYKTAFDYGYDISTRGQELLLISLDSTLTKIGFNVYGVCEAGSEWSSDLQNCTMCPSGQYKTVANQNSDMSYQLCFPCPGGSFTGPITGISSEEGCRQFNCTRDEFCPDGSVYPLLNIPVDTVSDSNPNPLSTDNLDFESTFYNSYPWFLVILGFSIILTVSICLPWPRYNNVQAVVIKGLLKLNFYDWDGEDMTVEEDYLEQSNSPSININGERGATITHGSHRSVKRGIFIRKRRTKVKPQKAVESFCSYYFLLVLGMMILFLVQFQKVNSDVSIELRAYGQSSTDLDLREKFTEIQYLKFLDTSPLRITMDLFGYTGQCTSDEMTLIMKGCQTPNYMGICAHDISIFPQHYDSNVTNASNETCRIVATFDKGVEFSDVTTFTFNIAPLNHYFYAQRIVYNISTINNASMINSGNSYVTGVVQPPLNTILRPIASVSVLSMLTFITDCKIHSSSADFTLVRPMVEKCLFSKDSYKDYSFISNATTYMDPSDYHDVNAMFSFTINIEKSVFFRYVTSSHSVSFGQIITVILFAILDVFWVIEVFVPVIQTVVALFESAIEKNKRKEYDEIGKMPANEMDSLIRSKQLS
eukprot:gene12043-14090_t